MNKLLEVLKVCFTAIGGWLGFYLGCVEALIYTLLAFVILGVSSLFLGLFNILLKLIVLKV
ncbi:hypothetical protein [Anaerococcus cruorum]|uniref:hypothetical protein n=1 Tax=Anaerococcus sp. WGS1596 TaxID=3366806 RepID=UPI00372D5B90